VNLDTASIRLRPRTRRGPPSRLTELQIIELLAWQKARDHLGTQAEWRAARKALGCTKTKARELGVSIDVIDRALKSAREREIK
jgi:transposase